MRKREGREKRALFMLFWRRGFGVMAFEGKSSGMVICGCFVGEGPVVWEVRKEEVEGDLAVCGRCK